MHKWFLAALLTLVVPAQASAWGETAHKTICEIAFQELDRAAKDEVERLMRLDREYRYFHNSCIWPDRPRKRGSEHYVHLQRDQSSLTEDCPMASKCVVTAIEKDLKVLKDSSASDSEKLEALKYLGHWVGDIHQPLHVSFEDDRSGNSIKESGPCKKNLDWVWDICIFEERFGDDPVGAAAVLHQSISDTDRSEWLGATPRDWANESLQITLRESVGYCVQKSGECWYESDNKVLDDHEDQKTVVVDSDYITEHSPIVADRVKRAGVRLGGLLNEAFTGR